MGVFVWGFNLIQFISNKVVAGLQMWQHSPGIQSAFNDTVAFVECGFGSQISWEYEMAGRYLHSLPK